MGKILVAVAMAVVVLVLCLGLYTLFKGGNVSRTWSNRLMRIRIVAQAVTILIVIAVVYFSHNH
ncbi:MAG TPA: twin transmembrane helix small protein [Rhizomicrobium sp.]|jgi:uncharacterized membrane protein|nr:twin transmembrane helix small protein [Rhizomicrobium sp.]